MDSFEFELLFVITTLSADILHHNYRSIITPMRYLCLFQCLAWQLLVCAPAVYSASDDTTAPRNRLCSYIEVFSREACPHCAAAYAFLDDLKRAYPELVVRKRDIDASPDAWHRFVALNEQYAVAQPGVPSFLICGKFYSIGFDRAETTGVLIKQLTGRGAGMAKANADEVDLPLFGEVSISRFGLPLFTLAIGLVDGFNPCAM